MPTKKELIEFEMTVVIPVERFSNVQPVVKGYGETWDEARADADAKAKQLWAEYAQVVDQSGNKVATHSLGKETSNTTAITTERETLKCYVSGTELLYDDASHTYVDSEGASYLSGSNFAHQFGYDFNKAAILPKYATKHELKEHQIDDYWQAKAKCSTTWGTAIHQAMETYGMHKAVADKVGREIGVHPLILPMVEEWFAKHPGNYVFEKFVADKDRKYCGRIDCIQLTGSKTAILRDVKTNGDLHKQGSPKNLKFPYTHLPNTPLGQYTLQLNFYRSILEVAGWTVEGMYIDHLTHEGDWEEIKVTKVDIENPQAKIDLTKI